MQRLWGSSDCWKNLRKERKHRETVASATDSQRVPYIQCSWRHDPHLLERHHPRSLQSKDLYIQTNFDGRIYSLSIECGPQYPQKPPILKFNNKINIPCVNQNNGYVQNLGLLQGWKETTTLENILVAIKNEMVNNKGLKQPPEDAYYWFVCFWKRPLLYWLIALQSA